MKEAAKTSPFAAMNPREQKEQWIWWQCQHPAHAQVMQDALDTPRPLLDTSATPRQEEVQRELPPVPAPVIRHGQYDSVIRRINQARQQASAYIPCTASVIPTTKPEECKPETSK
ncbi:MAG: hypothetical protein ACI4MJ_03460 [Aristaeellaceae bacterium]